ncbi:hypothetical protein PF005_g15828 [Phytophthora fragariae]|nr:hypothetical protein PF009_g16959 [Phytophthora fragariae]KAE9098966.1 hypothetical protein PF010_g15363 [Phytophthora fragariae]KAE9134057.1 hypothetical protein PF006_g14911 [Phytophthora fragariae]KAE9199224.1 hypothetical protein PF005_g15828 [Phytophthora fragariae]KAE9217167.1 hypothetical protein PF002_g16879 [Phytophthora fragariae]
MHSFVYKARRKRSIEYVAVKSTAKSRMDKILNEVPFLHKLDSRYVLKFFDWYESSNHIWLILEYCMGGDLLNLITQDKQLPETAVKSFGIELVAGLQYLHANSILYCDLKPANVLIDEFGSLKLADFGLARRIPGSDTAATRPLAPGSPHYMAPELFQQPAVHSFASDFWALGCVLYELRTGRQPFTHTNFSELARKIQTDTVVLPVPGYEMSPVFCNLLQRLLVKDPYQRITWNELIDHPFWDNLPQLEDVVMPAQEMFDAAAPTPGRYPNISAESSDSINFADHPHDQSDDQHENNEEDDSTAGATGAVQRQTNGSGPITTVTEDDRAAISESGDSSSEDLLGGLPVQRSITSTQVHDEARPVSAPSSRMRATTSNNEDLDEEADAIEDQHIGSIPLDVEMRHRWRAAKAPHSAPPAISNAPRRRIQLHSLFDRDGVPGGGLRKVSKLIFTAADCRVKSIIGNKDIQIGDLPRIRAEHLRFEPTAPQDLLSCSTEALESQLKDIYVSLKSSQAGDTEKLSVMAYLFSLSCHARLAHVIVNSSILKLLIRMLTHESRLSVANRVLLPILCLVLGVLFRFATFIAPSSPDQLRQLVTTLLQVLHDSPSKSNTEGVSGGNELESRSLALGCLGELLFYISTQQEWELPMDGVDGVLTRVNDADIGVRYYAVRTLGNMLIHCTDMLLPKLMSEQIVATLTRSLLQYAEVSRGEQNDWEASQTHLALRTTTTEALAQVFRHLRTPSSVANLPSRLKRSVLLYFAKPEVLNAVWRGVQNEKGAIDLAVASLNIINAFLDTKIAADREADSAAIKASRQFLLDRVVTFSSIQKILLLKGTTSNGVDSEGSDFVTILRAKSLITLHLGMQLNRGFLLSIVENDALKFLEQVLFPIADHLYEDDDKPGSLTAESTLSAFELYLSQCALNLCKLAIRMALKLGADCFSSQEHGDTDRANNNNATISPLSFELFNGLLRNPTCRLQLLNYFMGNDNKQYTFFLRLMAKLLTAFPNEELSISRESDTTTVAFYASKILLNLFESSAREANNIVLVETHVLFTHLLPAVLVHISPTEGSTYGANNDGLAVNCLKILHVVLLDFDYEDDNGEYELYDHFIRSTLVPCLDSLLNEHAIKVESTWSLASELLFGLISSDSSLLSEAKELRVMSAILGLLSVSPKFQALPSHATQLLNVLVDSYNGHLDELYESGIAESVVAGLAFATRRKVLDTNLVDLLVVLQHLLHQQHDSSRQQSLPAAPQGFNELVRCGPILIQLCVGTDAKRKVHGRLGDLSPEEDEIEGGLSPRGRNRVEDDKIADLVSRCLVFLSQIFGEQLNEAVFLNGKEPVNEYLSSLLLLCLQPNDLNVDGVVMLRLLLMLKNCLRCEGNNAYVSNWMTEDSRVLKAVKELASQHQDVRLENERGKSGQQRSVPSIGEQISRTSAAIVRLCRS